MSALKQKIVETPDLRQSYMLPIPDQAQAILTRFDTRVEHFEVLVEARMGVE